VDVGFPQRFAKPSLPQGGRGFNSLSFRLPLEDAGLQRRDNWSPGHEIWETFVRALC